MDTEFLPNNSHLRSIDAFIETDPHLSRLASERYVYHSSIIDELPTAIPGIYNIGGGRQIGKTTLLKQWMLYLLEQGVTPQAIAFLSCELIVDERSLYRIVTNQLEDMPETGYLYLILDEITYVRGWDKAIKYLADTAALSRVILIISGSDLTLMKEARIRFPGRRGKADKVDFHYYPLSFSQVVNLKHGIDIEDLQQDSLDTEVIETLFTEIDAYQIHGGFLTAINEYAETNRISERTLATYSDWIRGDIIKRGKSENYLIELLQAIIKHYSSQISWRHLVNALSIDHTQTAIDYASLLESMDTLFIQSALLEDKLVGAPKKHRKLMFTDPFIYHAVYAWLYPSNNPFEKQILKHTQSKDTSGKLIESIVATHFRRFFPTYYIKAEAEVDIAYIKNGRFYPIEVKWTNQLRKADLKQIVKYKNGAIWAKLREKTLFQKIPVYPLPIALASIETLKIDDK